MEIFQNVLTYVSLAQTEGYSFVQLSDYVQIINGYCLW
jgi:hypothetical protein